MPTTPRRSNRTIVELPEPLVASLRDLAAQNEITRAELYYLWIVQAAQLAHSGYGHLLPQEKRARRGSLGEVKQVRWKQGVAERDRCREAIEAAGSSIPAVLREAGGAYVAAQGDVVGMAWPAFQRRESGATEAA